MPRDTAGNYTLPAGNPVASGEIIAASWANSTMNDLGQSLSASLDRYGRGGMLAPFQFTDGTESAPGATWSNEPTTGLYRAAYGDLRFTLTGTDVQRWTNANSYLWRNNQWEEIITSSGGGGSTTINDLVVTGSFTSPGIDDNATSTAITIDANENVTVGGTTAGNAGTINVSVGSPGSTIGGLQLWAGTSGSHFMQFGDSASGDGYYRGAVGYLHESDALVAYSAGTERMRIDSSGNVSIGTPNSLGALTIKASASDDQDIITITEDGIDQSFSINGNFAGAGSTGNAITLDSFWANDIISFRGDGNVGIGTDSPVYLLDLQKTSPALRIKSTSTATGVIMDVNDTSGQLTFLNYNGDFVAGAFGANTAQFRTSNTERMRIDASGNLLVGDTSSYLSAANRRVLQATGSTDGSILSLQGTSGDFYIHSGGGNTANVNVVNRANGYMNFFTNNTERMRIDSSGNVGIGTASPAAPLHVAGQESGVIARFHDGVAANCYIEGAGPVLRFANRAGNGQLGFTVNNGGSDAMRLDSAGNLGLGVTGGFLGSGSLAMARDKAIRWQDATNGTVYADVYGASDSSLVFRTGNAFAEAMRINSSGNVGIGTGSPSNSVGFSTLDIRNTTGGQIVLGRTGTIDGYMYSQSGLVTLAASTGNAMAFLTNSAGGGANEAMRIDTSGNLRVAKSNLGISTVGHALEANGVASISTNSTLTPLNLQRAGAGIVAQFWQGTSAQGSITSNTGGAPTFASASDERLKDNIVDHESELANVMSLRPTRWDWKDEASGSGEGFIAQELEDTAWSDLVSEGEDGFKMVSGLGAVETRLIKAMQEQQAMIETLQAEVAALKGA